MVVNTEKEYNIFPDGTIFRVFLTGDDWDTETGTVEKCVKLGNKLIPIKDGFFYFNEKDDISTNEDFSFVVCKTSSDGSC